MPRFVCKTPVEHDGAPYKSGDVVVLTEAQAAAMPWAVERMADPAVEEKQVAKKGK